MAKILIVDDDKSIIKTLDMLLTSEGHEVIAVSVSSDAIDSLNSNDIDLVLTDIRMPHPDGMELLKMIRKSRPKIPVIMVSAYGSEKTKKDSLDMGCYAYLAKPFKLSDIMDAVNGALGIK